MKSKLHQNIHICYEQQQPFPKQIGSDFPVQKLPIENHESENNILSDVQLCRKVKIIEISEPSIINNEKNNLKVDRKIIGASTESISSLQSKELGIPNYQRLSIFGKDEISLKSEEIQENCKALLTAIKMRRRYMNASNQQFHKTTNRYLSLMNSGCDNNDHHKVNLRLSIAKENSHNDSICHTPSTQENPYKIPDKFPDKLGVEFQFKNGVMTVTGTHDGTEIKCPVDYLEFVRDYHVLAKVVNNRPLKSFCFNRLDFINYRFKMHILLNEWKEIGEQKLVPHRDFYNIRKVDTHIHASSCMNQKHLLRFIKKCIKQFPNEEVIFDEATGKAITLFEVFELTGLTTYDLTIDKLDVHCTT